MKRRSVRTFTAEPLTQDEVSQILWAAQGITSANGYRTAPSAGALYPLEVYAVIGNVKDVLPGIYRYTPENHGLMKIKDGDRRDELCAVVLRQSCVKESAAIIVFAAVYERTTKKYGDRGIRYVHIETGHAGQNVYLQAVSLGLGTVMVGAFDDDGVRKVLGVGPDEWPLGVMPVGRVRAEH